MATKGPSGNAAERREKTAKPKSEDIFENPLLPHAKLIAMYAGMLECKLLERRAASLLRGGVRAWLPFAGREALLTGVMHNLLPQDWVSVGSSDPVMRFLRGAAPARLLKNLREGKTIEDSDNGVLPPMEDVAARLAMAAGVALAGKAAKQTVAVAYLDASETRADWTDVLATAAKLELPMIFVCQDKARATPATKTLRNTDWKRLGTAAARLGVPVIPVDGQDLIAMYRVAQESIGRARMGLGPTVIWCMRWELGPRRPDPLVEFERYLTARRLFTPAGKRRIAAVFAKKLKQA